MHNLNNHYLFSANILFLVPSKSTNISSECHGVCCDSQSDRVAGIMLLHIDALHPLLYTIYPIVLHNIHAYSTKDILCIYLAKVEDMLRILDHKERVMSLRRLANPYPAT